MNISSFSHLYINGTKFIYISTTQISGYSSSYNNTSVTVTFNPYTGSLSMVSAPIISLGSISGSPFCAGSTISVPYTATGT